MVSQDHMIVAAWNCRGAGSSLTIPCLKEVIHLHSPNIIFLCETKNQKKFLNGFKRKIGFEEMALVDPVGKAGGLAVFWKKATNVLDVLSTPFTLELMLNIDNDAGTWWCIFVYASTDDNMRKNQWDFLTNRSKIWGKNKVLIGDFNDIISNDEKWGGRVRPNWTFSDFKGFINNNELLDIGFEGLPWTWSNLWEGDGEIKQRLDRALASEEWCEVFKDARVTHFEVEASDHNILLLETEPRIRKPKRRFHFDSRWLQYREVEGIIQEAWGKNQVGSRGVRISRKIKQCRMNLSAWSRTLKLNSKKEIKRIKEEIHATRSRNGNNAKEAIKMLRKQLSEAYKQEELYWNQRARINWLQKGDKNTAYFHAVVNGRRKRNRITRLEKEQGGWCTTEEEFGEEITQFYNQLFTSSKPSDFDEILNGIPRTITEQMNLQLTRPVTEKEIRIAVFSMHPNKSPGPDGMSPVFFQKFWNIIKVDIIDTIQGFFHSGFLSKAINETLVTLIPKIDNPLNLAHFRPISLCNVFYKIISKILVNRLKPLLNSCISYSQAAFVPNRQILDNVMVAHEYMHWLK